MKESTLWIIDIVALSMLAVTLGIHLYPHSSVVSGLGISEALKHESVLVRAKDPLYLITYTIFLGSILYHSMYRLKSMISELYPDRRFEKMIAYLCLAVGLTFFVYGFYINLIAYLG